MTHFPFEVSIVDDDKWEENENFFLTIDESSLPCNVTVGNQHKSTVTILDDDGKEIIITAIKYMYVYTCLCINSYKHSIKLIIVLLQPHNESCINFKYA